MTAPVITDETKVVTGTQAIASNRWPFGRDTFYRMVRQGLITKHFAYEGARPTYHREEIDRVFGLHSGEQNGEQSDY